jgi:tRNA 2-thiouridine synthesizing protein E
MAHVVARDASAHSLIGLPLDEDGFLIGSTTWDRALAQQLADDIGVGRLGPTHWLIIDFMRDRYFGLGALPPMRQVCRKLGVERHAVKQSFGTCRAAWQIAGLPNPGPEALAYMA